MNEETLNERVITVFNNWFLNQHGLLPQQAIDRIEQLEAELDTVKSAYSDLLVNAVRELNELEQKS